MKGDATRHAPPDWGCEICGDRSLTFQFVNGHCACDTCGADYTFRTQRTIHDAPKTIMLPAFQEVFKAHWDEHKRSIDHMTQAEFDELLVEAGLPVEDDDGSD